MRQIRDIPLDAETPVRQGRATYTGKTLVDYPMQTSIVNYPMPTYGHALTLFRLLGHKDGCPSLSPSPTGPCLCVLHKDTDAHGKRTIWRWQ